ncbi:hypothetical protein [Streptomyces sp. NPDC055085]
MKGIIMAILNQAAILGASDVKTQEVPVPEWCGEVLIRALTGEQRDKFEASCVQIGKGGVKKMNLAGMRARLVAMSIVNEAGEPIFVPADVPALSKKSASALDRVFQACQKLSGLSPEDVEELVEDFDETPSGASTSD